MPFFDRAVVASNLSQVPVVGGKRRDDLDRRDERAGHRARHPWSTPTHQIRTVSERPLGSAAAADVRASQPSYVKRLAALLGRALVAISLAFLGSLLGTQPFHAGAAVVIGGERIASEMEAANFHEFHPAPAPASGVHRVFADLGNSSAPDCGGALGAPGCCVPGMTAAFVVLHVDAAALIGPTARALPRPVIFPEAIYRPPRLA